MDDASRLEQGAILFEGLYHGFAGAKR
jgi:hypothetical protein